MQNLEYFAPGFSCIEEVEAEYGTIMDASTLVRVARCPRLHEVRVEKNLDRPASTPKMMAGIVIHDSLDVYYAHPVRDEELENHCIDLARDAWNALDIDRGKMDKDSTHLTTDHIVQVLKNYFAYYGKTVVEVYKPLAGFRLDNLNLDQVVAARFKLLPDETLVLGESSLVMAFPVNDDVLLLAGKPDFPVIKDGRYWSMDHKTTSQYLSDWWADKHAVSNKDRGYMAMLQSLLQQPVEGSVINGIYVGKYATSEKSKATKFHRYEFKFAPDHVTEAINNQYAWRRTIDFYRDLGYFPQGCHGGCALPDLCRIDPVDRAEVERTEYEPSTRTFWGL